jgi:hypothetical protein
MQYLSCLSWRYPNATILGATVDVYQMGRDIVLYEDEYSKPSENSSSPLLVQQLVRQIRSLSPSDLRLYFESLFQHMSTSSKEAMTELMWTGLSTAEQQAFEMPYFGHRWAETSVYNALRDAFVPQEQPSPPGSFTTRSGRSLRLTDSTTSHFSAGISPRTMAVDNEAHSLEEQFFAILRDAITRADRTATNTNGATVRVVARTANTGMNTHNTDDHHSQRLL